jgi:hypothetical protein
VCATISSEAQWILYVLPRPFSLSNQDIADQLSGRSTQPNPQSLKIWNEEAQGSSLRALNRDKLHRSWLDRYLLVVAEAAEQKHYEYKLRHNKAHSRGSSCLHYSIKTTLTPSIRIASRVDARASSLPFVFLQSAKFVISPVALSGGQEGLDSQFRGL